MPSGAEALAMSSCSGTAEAVPFHKDCALKRTLKPLSCENLTSSAASEVRGWYLENRVLLQPVKPLPIHKDCVLKQNHEAGVPGWPGLLTARSLQGRWINTGCIVVKIAVGKGKRPLLANFPVEDHPRKRGGERLTRRFDG